MPLARPTPQRRWQGFLIPDSHRHHPVSGDPGRWSTNLGHLGTEVVNAWSDGSTQRKRSRSIWWPGNLPHHRRGLPKRRRMAAGGPVDASCPRARSEHPCFSNYPGAARWNKTSGCRWNQNLDKPVAGLGSLPSAIIFSPSATWVGSTFFVRSHPFFKDLPVNGAMNWEYQQLVLYNSTQALEFGLYNMTGEQPVVSLWGASKLVSLQRWHHLYGNGQIAFSSLALTSNLLGNINKASNVAKKIMSNYMVWGATAGPIVPNPPAGLSATGGNGQILLNWIGNGSASYTADAFHDDGGLYTVVSNLTATILSMERPSEVSPTIMSWQPSTRECPNSSEVSATLQSNTSFYAARRRRTAFLSALPGPVRFIANQNIVGVN